MRAAAESAFGPGLGGCCASASHVLAHLLRKGGFPGLLVAGYFRLPRGRAEHCWVESGDLLLDVTATQFGRRFPAVLLLPAPDPRYLPVFRGPAALRRVRLARGSLSLRSGLCRAILARAQGEIPRRSCGVL